MEEQLKANSFPIRGSIRGLITLLVGLTLHFSII